MFLSNALNDLQINYNEYINLVITRSKSNYDHVRLQRALFSEGGAGGGVGECYCPWVLNTG